MKSTRAGISSFLKSAVLVLTLCGVLGHAQAQSFTGTAVSGTQINLTWPPAAVGELYRWNNAGGYWNGLLAGWATSYADTGLAPGTTYSYVYYSYEYGTWQQIWVTTPTPPAAPSLLSGSTVSASQVNLAWADNSSNESGFRVERKTGAGGTYAQIATVAANATNYSNTGLTADTVYYYRVRAYGIGGNSAYTSEVQKATAPVAPTGLSASGATTTQINLSWNDVSTSETGFKIERKAGIAGAYAQIGVASANATSFSDSVPSGPTVYYYRVRSANADADSTYSNEAMAAALPEPGVAHGTLEFLYDAFGNLIRTDAGGVVTTLSYDGRGRKIAMTDPDMGTWSYAYNALGELVSQTDAKNQTTTMQYDLLGRMTSRTEPDLVSTWTYDACTKGVGKLCSASSDNGYARTHTYDSLGRPTSLAVTVDASYTVSTTYVASGADAGKVDTVTYPTGYAVKNLYNAYGYLWKVQRADDPGDTTVYWQANAQDAAGHITSELLGNGLTQTRTYDALFRPTSIAAANAGGAVHHLTYNFDAIGNVIQRVNVTQAVTENFTYDTLNRLISASGPGLTTRSFDYDPIGNMTYKSDVGSYAYPGPNGTRPHAVSSVNGGGAVNTVTASYTYDANGNLSASSGTIYPGAGSTPFSRTLTYTSFNMPLGLTHVQGSATYSYTYTYNAEHERVKLVTVRPTDTLTSIYLHPAGKGALLYEKETRASDGQVEHKHYVNGGAGLIGVFVTKSTYATGQGPEMRYYHKDHLGSVAAITNASAAVLERLAFEAFGERRFTNGSAQDRSSPLFGITTDRGYTAHEHLDEMNLIHMNGRIYDPALGRFMTSDPFIAGAANLQAYNRYAYVHNNPLMYTDPSGYFLKKALKRIGRSVRKALKSEIGQIAIAVAVVSFGAPYINNALIAGGAEWAVATSLTATEFGIASYATLSAAGTAVVGASVGFAIGTINGGSVDAGLKGAVSGAILGGIDGHFGASAGVQRAAARAFGSGVAARIQGGRFEDGFLGSAINSGARYIYATMVGYDVNAAPGENRPGDQQDRQFYEPDRDARLPLANRGMNIVGPNAKLDGSWGILDGIKQGGALSRALNVIPGINAIGGLDDYWQNRLERIVGQPSNYLLLPATIPGSVAVTLPALVDRIPVYPRWRSW